MKPVALEGTYRNIRVHTQLEDPCSSLCNHHFKLFIIYVIKGIESRIKSISRYDGSSQLRV